MHEWYTFCYELILSLYVPLYWFALVILLHHLYILWDNYFNRNPFFFFQQYNLNYLVWLCFNYIKQICFCLSRTSHISGVLYCFFTVGHREIRAIVQYQKNADWLLSWLLLLIILMQVWSLVIKWKYRFVSHL